MPVAVTPETHMQHLPTILAYKDTLPAHVFPIGSFPGGLVWALGDEGGHYVVILLPPYETSWRRMSEYFGEFFGDDWRIVSQERFGSVEAVHLMPPSRG